MLCSERIALFPIVLCQLLFYKKDDVFAAFVRNPSNSTSAVVGEEVTLEWTTSLSIDELTWGIRRPIQMQIEVPLIYVSGSNKVQFKQDGTGEPGERYKGRISFTGDLARGKAVFKIIDVQPSDAAEYGLTVLETGETLNIFTAVKLLVIVPANVTHPQVKSHYILGDKVNITCQATGTPLPTVKWIRRKDNKEYPSSIGVTHLVFNSVRKEDDGKYTCMASNSGGNAQVIVNITVYYKPENTRLTSNASDNVALAGDYILFTCTVEAAKPAASQYKFFWGNTLLSSPTEGKYLVENIDYFKGGVYKCIPKNLAGDGQEATLTLTVEEAAKIVSSPSSNIAVAEGESIPLFCRATGHPTPTVTWTKDGQSFGGGGENVTISKSSKNDKGTYICTATNNVKGKQTSTTTVITVIVNYKPEINTDLSNSTVGSWNNHQITLQCVAVGEPDPTFSWYNKDNQVITNNVVPIPDGTKLTLTTSSEDDYGLYKCHATNVVGSTNHNITVNHWKKPGKPLQVNLKDPQASYVTVTWSPPADNGGSSIIDYKVEIQRNTETKQRLFADEQESTVYGLIPGATYSVLVYARNIVGYSEAEVLPFTTEPRGKPGISYLNITETFSTSLKLTWTAAAENGGKIITYTIWRREVDRNGALGVWSVQNTTNADLSYTVVGLESGKTYQFGVTAWNKYGQNELDEKNRLVQVTLLAPTSAPTIKSEKTTGVSPAVIGGGVAAAVIIILAVVIVIVFLKRRKGSPGKAGESRDPLGSNGDEGYSSVSKASAARHLGRNNAANDDAGIPTYATVDKSKKTPKKPDLIYAELADFNETPEARAASMKRHNQPSSYVPTDYAEITQFGRPKEEPMYDNVPRY